MSAPKPRGKVAFRRVKTAGDSNSKAPVDPKTTNKYLEQIQDNVEQAFSDLESIFGALVPIGAVLDWHKGLKNCPALPANFVPCDGRVIVDPRSPFNGVQIEDVNGQGLFTRASTISGTIQAADTVIPAHAHSMNNHVHDLGGHTHGPGTFAPSGGVGNTAGALANTLSRAGATVIAGWTMGGTSGAAVGNTLGPSVANTAADGGSGTETRPKNISYVKIMRIW